MHGGLDVFSGIGLERQDNPDREKNDQQCEDGADVLLGPLDVETELCPRNRTLPELSFGYAGIGTQYPVAVAMASSATVT